MTRVWRGQVKPDPPVRDDGVCHTCGKPRNTHRSSRYGRAEAILDPFCSTQCCRKYHGTEV